MDKDKGKDQEKGWSDFESLRPVLETTIVKLDKLCQMGFRIFLSDEAKGLVVCNKW